MRERNEWEKAKVQRARELAQKRLELETLKKEVMRRGES